jgi:glycine oxidase
MSATPSESWSPTGAITPVGDQDPSGRADVVVAGGGVIGMAVAWRCAQRGLSVTVVDDDSTAGDASGRGGAEPAVTWPRLETGPAGAWYAAAGMLAPVSEAGYGEEDLLALCRASLDRFGAFVAEVERAGGVAVGLRRAGTLVVGFDADDVRVLDDLHAYRHSLGLPAERITPGQARRREPALAPRLRGALHAPDDHSVDARALHAGLTAAARAAGVRLVRARIERLLADGGRASGVRLANGSTVDSERVVLATGAWSGTLPGVPALPVRPVKGQILRLRGPAGAASGRSVAEPAVKRPRLETGTEGLLAGTVRALVRGQDVYLVPTPHGGLIVGATVEELGFDPAVTAGAVYRLLRDAIEVVPAVGELELVETLARWRPGTPDNGPLLGPTALPGLTAATGHYRNGVLLTPITADAVAAWVAGDEPPDVARPFTPHRFAEVYR